MFGAIFDSFLELMTIKDAVAILTTGVVIKIMDDFLDKEIDTVCGKETFAARLHEGVLPYALLLLGVAVLLSPGLSLSLYLSAYAVGMAGDMRRRLPLGLGAWQECLIALAVGLLLCGWRQQIWALFIMSSVQAADDLLDATRDRKTGTGEKNMAVKWGTVEAVLVAAICLISSFLLNWSHTILVILGTPAVLGLMRVWERKMPE